MFCQNCGSKIPEGDHFCPICGNPVGAAPKTPSENDRTGMFSPEDCAKNRFLAALCYLSIIFIIIGLLLEPDSKFLRYHINQCVLLYVLSMASAVVMIIPIVGWIAGTVASVAAIVFTIMGIVRAINGEARDLPIIGKYVVVNYD